MAYNDYGAFVYRDGHRRRDREDTTLEAVLAGDYDPGLAGDMAIYAELLSRTRDDGSLEQVPFWAQTKHAILGTGPVYVLVYKYGLRMCELVHVTDGQVDDVLDEHGMRAILGPSADATDDGSSYADPLGERPTTEPLSLGWHGCDLAYVCRDPENAANDGRAQNSLAFTEPDGTVWRAFYGSAYGAGLTDVEPWAHHLFDELAESGEPRRWHALAAQRREMTDEEDEGDDTWYRLRGASLATTVFDVRTASVLRDDESVPACTGTIALHGETYARLSSLVSPNDVERLVNLGIALAHEGIDHVEWGGSSWGLTAERLAGVKGAGRDALVAWARGEGPASGDA